MGARFAQPDAAYPHVPDEELTTHEMVERNPARHHVPPRVAGGYPSLIVASHRLDRLELDERNLPPRPRLVGVRASGEEVPVPLEATPRDGADALNGARWLFSLRRNV